MLKRLLLFFLALAATPAAAAFDYRPALRQTERILKSGHRKTIADETDRALGGIVRAAELALRARGYKVEADDLAAEWRYGWQGYLPAVVMAQEAGLWDVGDHAPLSQWLADWYEKWENLLGEPVMKLLHLDDVWVLNYTIPVVFHYDRVDGDGIDQAEYQLHWVPFSGVVAYWGTWIACEAATWGSGWIVICTPAGMIAEHVTVKFIAPPLTPTAWKYLWRPEAMGD